MPIVPSGQRTPPVHLRGNSLVARSVMLCAIREEIVNDHADDWEKEDDEAPDDLVQRRTVRLDDLDYKVLVSIYDSKCETRHLR